MNETSVPQTDYKALYETLKAKQREASRKYQQKTDYKAIREYLKRNPTMRIFNAAKSNAKRKGIDFTITLDDLVIPTLCPYLGVPLTNIYGQGRVKSNVSLDRIDSTLGYVPGNVQIISDLANRMKQEATPNELLAFARGVMEVHGLGRGA